MCKQTLHFISTNILQRNVKDVDKKLSDHIYNFFMYYDSAPMIPTDMHELLFL